MTMESPAGRRGRSALRLPRVLRQFGLVLAATALAVAMPADATAYKWVDDRGQVHYTDQPPPGVQYEIVAMPKPAATQPPPPAVATPPLPPARPETAAGPAPVTAADEATDDGACVDALYQITLLRERRPVFKQAADRSRRYLEDAARPAELRRLEAARDASCSSDPEVLKSQEARARRPMVALSRNRAEARVPTCGSATGPGSVAGAALRYSRSWDGRRCSSRAAPRR
jgi:hypothetical protein